MLDLLQGRCVLIKRKKRSQMLFNLALALTPSQLSLKTFQGNHGERMESSARLNVVLCLFQAQTQCCSQAPANTFTLKASLQTIWRGAAPCSFRRPSAPSHHSNLRRQRTPLQAPKGATIENTFSTLVKFKLWIMTENLSLWAQLTFFRL